MHGLALIFGLCPAYIMDSAIFRKIWFSSPNLVSTPDHFYQYLVCNIYVRFECDITYSCETKKKLSLHEGFEWIRVMSDVRLPWLGGKAGSFSILFIIIRLNSMWGSVKRELELRLSWPFEPNYYSDSVLDFPLTLLPFYPTIWQEYLIVAQRTLKRIFKWNVSNWLELQQFAIQ